MTETHTKQTATNSWDFIINTYAMLKVSLRVINSSK